MAAVASSSRACAPAAWNAHELDLPNFAYAAHRDPLNARTLEAIGVTTRKYRRGALYRTLRSTRLRIPTGSSATSFVTCAGGGTAAACSSVGSLPRFARARATSAGYAVTVISPPSSAPLDRVTVDSRKEVA